MLSLRAHAIICAGIFAAIVVLAAAGSAVQAAGLVRNPARIQTPMLVLFVTLTAALAFSAIPVMVKLVLGAQRAAGNQDVAAISAAIAHEKHIIWAIWALMFVGLVIAVPAALIDWLGLLTGPGSGPSEGTLVVAPGMPVADMMKASTLTLKRNAKQSAPDLIPLPTGGGATFDLDIAGTGFVIPNCKYYYVSGYTKDPTRVEAVNVGTSLHKVGRAELEQANTALRARLTAAGWLTGHEEYRDEQDRTLHGGASRGPEGSLWLKNEIVLHIEERRMDDEKPGEDKATAGEWIQYVDLRTQKDYPWIERWVFAPPAR